MSDCANIQRITKIMKLRARAVALLPNWKNKTCNYRKILSHKQDHISHSHTDIDSCLTANGLIERWKARFQEFDSFSRFRATTEYAQNCKKCRLRKVEQRNANIHVWGSTAYQRFVNAVLISISFWLIFLKATGARVHIFT